MIYEISKVSTKLDSHYQDTNSMIFI
jgi:hypothetical protein